MPSKKNLRKRIAELEEDKEMLIDQISHVVSQASHMHDALGPFALFADEWEWANETRKNAHENGRPNLPSTPIAYIDFHNGVDGKNAKCITAMDCIRARAVSKATSYIG